MKTSIWFVGILAALGLITGLFALNQTPATTVVDNSQPAGSVSSPDIQGPYYSVNGLVVFKSRIAMTKNASTTCSFRSPAATSTLSLLTSNVASSSSSATIWEFGTATNSFSTTTLIGTTYSLAAGAKAAWVASTTVTGGSLILAPNTAVNLKVGAPAPGFPQGTCDAVFTVL